MQRVFVMLKRKPGMSFEEFQDYYERSHVKLAEEHLGHLFASYRRNYLPQGMRFTDRQTIDNAYDCITELVFKDPDGYQELKRIVSEPEFHRILVEDEEKFLDRAACANSIPQIVESDLSKA